MTRTVLLNYPAPIPLGHVAEVTEYADTRPERKRGGSNRGMPWALPTVRDLESGIQYMNHVHAATSPNGGNAYTPNDYPRTPRADLAVASVWLGRVTGCAIINVEGLSVQHTALTLDVELV